MEEISIISTWKNTQKMVVNSFKIPKFGPVYKEIWSTKKIWSFFFNFMIK